MAINPTANTTDAVSIAAEPSDNTTTSSLLFASTIPDSQEWLSSRVNQPKIEVAGVMDNAAKFFQNFPSISELFGHREDPSAHPERPIASPEQARVGSDGHVILAADKKPPALESFTQATMPKESDLPLPGPEILGRPRQVGISHYPIQETASGEKMTATSLTAAHRTLPFGTEVSITFYNPKTQRTETVHGVKIIDDGPHHGSREIDVSPMVAQRLGLTDKKVDSGEATMTITKLGPGPYRNLDRELDDYWGRKNFSVYK